MSNAYSTSRKRSSLSTWCAFLVGGPVGVGVLFAIQAFPIPDIPEIQRYSEHPVEMAELVMFFCALGALLGKFLGNLNERLALASGILPAWNGEPQPIETARDLREGLEKQPGRILNTYFGQRVLGILDFVESRGAANELDDQLRTLADNDALALEGSYGLLRFINWAIPILGFLGTVVGITGAIYGITPEILEKSLEGVTGGLATAFDTTALALTLTMVLMFFTFVVERIEQNTLEQVDHHVDLHLAHRFERTGAESGQFVEALRRNTQVLLKATEQIVEKQVQLWSGSFERADRQWNETGSRQQEKLSQALTEALERTLAEHSDRIIDQEQKLAERSQAMFQEMTGQIHGVFEGLREFADIVRLTSRQHQETLAQLTEKIASQTEVLAKVQEGEENLIRLQELLQQNLSILAGAGSFDQAVQSLTAAIHLLTTRLTTSAAAAATTGPRISRAA